MVASRSFCSFFLENEFCLTVPKVLLEILKSTFYHIIAFIYKHFYSLMYAVGLQKAVYKLHCKMHIFPMCIYLFCSILKKSVIMIMHSRKKPLCKSVPLS